MACTGRVRGQITRDSPENHGVLSRLSLKAVRSAAALEDEDFTALFKHLYTFNSIPLTSRWLERIPDSAAVWRELGLDSPSDVSAMLEARWRQVSDRVDEGWLVWIRPDQGGDLRGTGMDVKLYVSPDVDALSSVFPEVVRVATFAGANCIKVGAHVAGLLRPDKLLLYFTSIEDLVNGAHGLTRRLNGVPAQGVPFTAEISDDGLLAWGRDPPLTGPAFDGAVWSWREWVCRRLAAALVDSRVEVDVPEARWRIAIEQIRAEGVDTDRWSPSPALWRNPPW